MKQFFFMSGLQRSGSTLLGSLLAQNPDIHVSPTSPLLDFLCKSEGVLNDLEKQYTYDLKAVSNSMHSSTFDNFYNHIEKPIIVDKHRGWTRNIDTARMFLQTEPKVIVTYRPIAEVITSFITLADKDPNNAIDDALRKMRVEVNNQNRAKYIWEEWTLEIYESVKYGLVNNRENIHVVHYKKLVDNPSQELYNIYDFLGVDQYEGHYFENVENALSEQKDEVWGFKGLHDIRGSVNYQSKDPMEVIGPDLCHLFSIYDNFLNI